MLQQPLDGTLGERSKRERKGIPKIEHKLLFNYY
jgi:hypothetical protein